MNLVLKYYILIPNHGKVKRQIKIKQLKVLMAFLGMFSVCRLQVSRPFCRVF